MLPTTEQDNPKSREIDQLSTFDALQVINNEDALIATAIANVLSEIARVTDNIVDRLKSGGRLFYVGTGTSGRLGVLDASELPPTFGVPRDLVQGLIAGGYDALYNASEASEDDGEQGKSDLESRGLVPGDAVIGLAASGRTPYTIGAVEFASSLGCFTACITCVKDSEISRMVDIPIEAIVGPEVITGSTRMKAGTAQKMVLNMISTVTMIRLGYVKGNQMTNVKSTNEKLRQRSLRILITETGLDVITASELFDRSSYDLPVALVMHRAKVNSESASKALKETDFVVERAVILLK